MVNPDHDRLSHAQNFANELSESRLREMAEIYKRRWTPEKRTQKAQIIQAVRPWRHATGPKTEAGRAKSALNVWKSGREDRDMKAALRFTSKNLRNINMAARCIKLGVDIAPLNAYICAEAGIARQRILVVLRTDLAKSRQKNDLLQSAIMSDLRRKRRALILNPCSTP